MEYAVIRSDSPEKFYNVVKELIEKKKVMYESILYPYVDAVVMSRPEKKEIYFSDRVIINFDYIGRDEFEEFMGENDLIYHIRNKIVPDDICERPDVGECFKYAIKTPIAISKPYEIRAAARSISALAEIVDRILTEYPGNVIGTSVNEIYFDVHSSDMDRIFSRIREAEAAFYA